MVVLRSISFAPALYSIYKKDDWIPQRVATQRRNDPLHYNTFPNAATISNIQQLEQIPLTNIPIPSNLNIIMVGDSLSRYQYISLAYFLKYGKWINMNHPLAVLPNNNNTSPPPMMNKQPIAKTIVPHMGLINKNEWNSKDGWFNYSLTLLGSHHVCDCFEPVGVKQYHKRFGADNLENWYFRDPVKNNSVTFITKYGDANNYKVPLPFKSYWTTEQINSLSSMKSKNKKNDSSFSFVQETSRGFPRIMTNDDSNENGKRYYYQTNNWTEFIQEFVSQLNPKPNAFIFNQGLWPHEEFQTPLVYKEIVKAISNAGMISIYKTTTKWSNANDSSIQNYERDICKLTDYCLDLSWTWVVSEDLYTDRAHFYEPVYTWFNLQLLKILSSVIDLRGE